MRINNTIKPTHNQKRVLAKIIGASSPEVAYDQVSVGRNLIAARGQLINFALITLTSDAAEVTELGRQVAQQEGITDESGELTELGQGLAATDESNRPVVQTESNEFQLLRHLSKLQ